MQKTIKIKLAPTKEQKTILDKMSKEYIDTVNMLVTEMIKAEKILNISIKEFFAYLPSAVKNQCIRDAKSIYKKFKTSRAEMYLLLITCESPCFSCGENVKDEEVKSLKVLK